MIYFFIADLIRGHKVYVILIVAPTYVISTYICLGEHACTYLPDSLATGIRLIIFTLVDHALRRVLTAINTSSSSSGRTPSLVFLLDSIQDNWLNRTEHGREGGRAGCAGEEGRRTGRVRRMNREGRWALC